MKNLTSSVGGLVLGIVALGSFALAGCADNCPKLQEKVCTDLGPEDCAVWKGVGAHEDMIPKGGRGISRACGMMMNEPAYTPLLGGARATATAHKNAAKAKAK